jgi:hypothetical protein
VKHPLATGIAVGATLGALARRWWDRRARAGALGSLGLGLTEGVSQVGLALMQATPPWQADVVTATNRIAATAET